MEDMNERRRAEEALGESENLLRAIVDTEPECVEVLAPDGTVEYATPSTARVGLPWLEKPFRFAEVRRVVAGLLAR